MTESLDNILSGQRDAAPAQAEEKIETQAVEQPPENLEAEQQQEQSGQQKMVPHEALHAEKQKVKRYTEQIASFEKTIAERDAAWERRFGQLIEKLGPQPQAPAQIDWYSDPEGAMNQGLQRAVTPLEQKFSNIETQIMRLSAVQEHGAEKVSAFEKYVAEAISRNDPEMVALSAQMRASPDPIGTGLQWFEKRMFDPDAERERLREEIRKEFEGSQPSQQQTQARVMPSNLAGARNVGSRAGPVWSGPPALGDIFKK